MKGSRHEKGVSCFLTGIRDIVNINAIEIDDALLFGFGTAMSFNYKPDSEGNGPMISGLSPMSLSFINAVNSLNIKFTHYYNEDSDIALDWMIQQLKSKKQVLLYVDLMRYHNWLNSHVDTFAGQRQNKGVQSMLGIVTRIGHVILLTGYQKKSSTFSFFDNTTEELLYISREELFEICSLDQEAKWNIYNECYTLELSTYREPSADIYMKAIEQEVNVYLHGSHPYCGYSALKSFVKDFNSGIWGQHYPAEKLVAILQFMYFNIYILTGGLYRKEYASFLMMVFQKCQTEGTDKVAKLYMKLALEWRKFARSLLPYTKIEKVKDVFTDTKVRTHLQTLVENELEGMKGLDGIIQEYRKSI